jgi:predicted dithiol-disulfide oxidoreductase (DUF899 family)
MVKQIIDSTFRQTNLPNESEEYLSRREEPRLAEIELRNQRERVAELRLASDIKERGIDELVPIWNVLDLTRQGRGDFYTKLEYPETA